MGKKYTTHTISIGDHNLDAPVMVQINALIADGLHSEAGYLTEESGTTKLTDAEIAEMGYIKTYTDTDTNTQLSDAQIAEMGYIKTYTDTDTNTQLSDAQIAEMGYIKTYTDTNTNTQLTSAQIAAMGYLSTTTGLEVFRSEKNIDDQGTYMFAQDDGGWTGGARLAGAHNGYGVISMHLHTGSYYGQIHLSSQTGDMGIRFQENSTTWGSIYTVHTSKHFSTTDVANGVTAHGWGNHADAGYKTTDNNTTYNFAGSTFTSRNSGNVIAIDSATSNMTGYTNESTAAGYGDGGLFVAAYSTAWVSQIFSNFRTGELSTRGKNSGTWQAWRTIHDSGHFSTTDVANGVTAHGWGNHADAGYLTSYTDTDTNTQLTTAQIAAMGYIKENEDRRHKVLRFTGEGSNSNNSAINYGIYQAGGAWSSPFPDLVIAMHTGIKIGGYPTYGGTRFYSDAPERSGAVELMSVGNGDADVRVTNVAYAGNSFRAPYFYSPGDTTYFLDPASSSVLFSVSAQHFYGNLTGNASTATTAADSNLLDGINSTSFLRSDADDAVNAGVTYTWARTDTAGLVFTNNSYNTKLYMGGWTTTNSDNISRIRTSSGNLHIDSAANGALYLNWYSNGKVMSDSIIESSSSVRAPIFYDTNDTGYYLNPASTSRLNGLTVNGSLDMTDDSISIDNQKGFTNSGGWTRNQTPYGYIDFGPANTGHAHIYTDRSNFYFNKYIQVSGGSRINTSDIRAKTFYDIDNTTYYTHPASTSVLNTLDLRGRFFPDATSDYDATAITSLTNAPIYFDELNVGTTNTYIPAFHMRSRYTSGYRTHMNVGLYKRASAWGDNDTGFYVALGGNDSYPTKHWKLTYGHSLYNSEGYVSTPGSFRAPTFYDSNNTAYYTNPAGTSVVQRITHINHTTPILIKVNSGYKSWVHHIASSNSYIFAPSTANGGESWDWANQMSISTSGVVTANNFVLSSDKRSKTKIKDLTCDNIDVSWKSFEMKGNEGDYRTGVIAQELEETNPEFVNTDEKGFKSVKYIDLLIAKIAELEARLEKLEK